MDTSSSQKHPSSPLVLDEKDVDLLAEKLKEKLMSDSAGTKLYCSPSPMPTLRPSQTPGAGGYDTNPWMRIEKALQEMSERTFPGVDYNLSRLAQVAKTDVHKKKLDSHIEKIYQRYVIGLYRKRSLIRILNYSFHFCVPTRAKEVLKYMQTQKQKGKSEKGNLPGAFPHEDANGNGSAPSLEQLCRVVIDNIEHIKAL